MQASDIWPALAAAAPGSRVVLHLTDGREIDIDRIEHFAGLVVVTPADGVTEAQDDVLQEALSGAATDIDEARGQFPDEDFLSPVILQVMELHGAGRANKEQLQAIVDALELLETETRQSTEYGREKLTEASKAIDRVTA